MFDTELKVFILLAMIVPAMQMAAKASNMSVSLLIALPLHPTSGLKLGWERGLEILPGALQAVDDINNDSIILPGHTLKLTVVDNGRNQFEIVQQFFNATFHQHIDIVGVSGILHPKTIPILLRLAQRTGVLLSGIIHMDKKLERLDYMCSDAFLSLPPASAMASVLLNFIKTMNWKHVGIVTDTKDEYFFSVAQKLMKTMVELTNDSLILSPYIESSYAAYAINRIIKSKVKIIIMSLSAEATIQLLCTGYERGLLWPQYVWILHSFQAKDFFSIERQSVCDIEGTINGMFFIDVQPQRKLITEMHYKAIFRSNRYAELLYDLVWAMAIAVNTSLYHNNTTTYMRQANPQATVAEVLQYTKSFHGRNDWTFRISFHLRNLQQILISTIQYSNSSITASSFIDNSYILENAPSGELPIFVTYPPLTYTVILGLMITLMTVFMTVTLVLYIYFRKEPEVKATSFTLSLLVYLGCYLNLLYLSQLLYVYHTLDSNNIARDNALCLGLQWLSGPGVPLPLMLATLLVKMLRIYCIFHNTTLRRIGHHCSDLALALYVLLILLPDIESYMDYL